MYSPDSIGLGHMRRHSCIADGLSRAMPDVSNLMIVGSAAGPYFELPERTDSIKLPSLLKTGANRWQARSLNVADEAIQDLRASLICGAIESFSPDIFLVDHVPAGIWHELVPALRCIHGSANRPHVVLGLRDILGAPQDIRMTWDSEGVYDLIEEFYDEILIYGCRDLFPAGDLYHLGSNFSGRVSYCGYIHSRRPCLDRDSARAKLGFSKQPSVVVTAGGGHDAFAMMMAALDAVAACGPAVPFETYMITGPLMPESERAALVNRAASLPVSVQSSTPDLPDYLSAADVVVTMGGYNTLMECVQRRKRTIVVPRSGPSAEQGMRAELFANLGLVEQVKLNAATGSLLHATILRCP